MADERDPRLSAHYRDLPREEPPRALDDAILAASRRGARRRPWIYPAVGIAAVMVLAVAITVQIERERPDTVAVLKEEVPLKPQVQAEKPAESPREEPRAAKPAEPPSAQPPRAAEDRVARPAARPAPERRAEARSGGFTPDPKPAAGGPPELARRDAAGVGAMMDRKQEAAEMRAEPGPAAAARSAPAGPPAAAPDARARQAERPLAALQMDEAPLPWLERIARLREAGKHEEADRALAEFRKRYPEFKISEELRLRVEKK
jgi:hypothetical protein